MTCASKYESSLYGVGRASVGSDIVDIKSGLIDTTSLCAVRIFIRQDTHL